MPREIVLTAAIRSTRYIHICVRTYVCMYVCICTFFNSKKCYYVVPIFHSYFSTYTIYKYIEYQITHILIMSSPIVIFIVLSYPDS